MTEDPDFKPVIISRLEQVRVAENLKERADFVVAAGAAMPDALRFCTKCCNLYTTAAEYNNHGTFPHGCAKLHTCKNQSECEQRLAEAKGKRARII